MQVLSTKYCEMIFFMKNIFDESSHEMIGYYIRHTLIKIGIGSQIEEFLN